MALTKVTKDISNIPSKIQAITAVQSSGALTFGLAPTSLDYRSTTLTTGATTTITNGALSLTLASGGTLGFVSAVQGRIAQVVINNAGTAELAVIALSGGNSLDETGLISTTAISTTATANNVFYSTTARTSVAYRVVGFVDAVNTTGAWAAPVLVQGTGGQASGDTTVRSALNVGGFAPMFACRAWVNFNGSTGVIRASGNVSSVTRNAVGDYTINFLTAMPDANYSVNALGEATATGNSSTSILVINSSLANPLLTSSVRLFGKNSSLVGLVDVTNASVSIFR